jgi:AAA15 family ATPase/GTPase
MLTKLTIRNFKKFVDVEIELGNPVVFVGPNNSGKTTALQALTLWSIGLKKWNEKRGNLKATNSKKMREGVPINRRDLVAVPVPSSKMLWLDLHIRAGKNQNIRVDIIVEGISQGKEWVCGLEFDYANDEVFYCRQLRTSKNTLPERMTIPDEALKSKVAFLPPMSGLSANEIRLDEGAINVRLGEGRTAEVLRNLCYKLFIEKPEIWATVKDEMRKLFGIELDEPQYIVERGELTMTYKQKRSDISLDLSSAGRGLQQTLLLLSYMAVNPNSILLLDEPDAHLEILRQRQTYEVLTRMARELNSQIVAASHSEVILNEAAERDVVVAFIGKPHQIGDRGNQLLKSLRDFGFDQYYQAEQKGWVLYLEGSTDLAILQAFAEKLDHPAKDALARPFVYYLNSNEPQLARIHFRAMREAKPDFVGFTLCDRVDKVLQPTPELTEKMWKRREIENYLCQPETLIVFAREAGYESPGLPLWDEVAQLGRETIMRECIENRVIKDALNDPNDPFWLNTKMSDEFLDVLFPKFFKKLNIKNLMRKTDYHQLARYVPIELISPEIIEVLNIIQNVAEKAVPAEQET